MVKKLLIITSCFLLVACSSSKSSVSNSRNTSKKSNSTESKPVTKEEILKSKNYVNAKDVKNVPINKSGNKDVIDKKKENENQNNSTPVIKSE
jgi:uncharacterized protein YcfL